MELKDKIKAKIDRLFEKVFNIEYLESSRYEQEPLKIDKIKISRVSITSFKSDEYDNTIEVERFEREVSIDFEPYPILSGDDAEEVYQHLIKENSNLLDKYLNE